MFVNMRKDSHIWFVLIALCFLVFVATGCKKARLRAQLKDMMTSTIVLPESIICVYNGEVFPMPDSLRDKPKLIVYIDSTECTTCRISHFWEYQELFDISKEIGSFEIMLLLCNKAFNSIPMTRYLSDRELEYPIYIDLDYRFLSPNPSIPTDPRLHSMLIDSTGRPIFVGDPSKSGQMMEAFSLALEHYYN